MQSHQLFRLNPGIPLCRFFSSPVAFIHFMVVRLGVLGIPACIRDAPGGIYKNLRNIWYSRLFRRITSVMVRSPFRSKALQLVTVNFPNLSGGCVITLCHTPWSRLLAQWCLENKFALIVTANKWDRITNKIKRNGRGFAELRLLIRHLQSGGRIIIMADVFNNLKNCSAKFLEKDCNVSLLPVRLAQIAEVPLHAAVPELENGTIHIHAGPRFDLTSTNIDRSIVMQTFMTFFEKEIRRNPSIWSVFVQGSLSEYQRHKN